MACRQNITCARSRKYQPLPTMPWSRGSVPVRNVACAEHVTAGVIALNSCKIPLVLPDDRSAIQAAIRSCGRADPTRVRLARIENTLRLEYILASVQSLEHLRPAADVEVLGPAMPFSFEPDGSPMPFATLARAQV